MDAKQITCPTCGTLFGVEPRAGILNIKNRDLFRTIRGGQVEGPCRRCGTSVRWNGSDKS